jgi:hypothetical protein
MKLKLVGLNQSANLKATKTKKERDLSIERHSVIKDATELVFGILRFNARIVVRFLGRLSV